MASFNREVEKVSGFGVVIKEGKKKLTKEVSHNRIFYNILIF